MLIFDDERGGATDDQGGAQDDQQDQDNQREDGQDDAGEKGKKGGKDGGADDSDEEEERKVRKKDHDRALADLHKQKTKAKQLEEELKKLKTNALKEKEDWKSLAEQRERELDELKEGGSKNERAFKETVKYNAVLAAARKLGIRAEAEGDLELLGLDEVEVEMTDSGRFRPIGADSFVQDLKKTKPHWFSGGKVDKINSGGTGGKTRVLGEDDLTSAKMAELERRDPKKFRELWPKYLEARKKARQQKA